MNARHTRKRSPQFMDSTLKSDLDGENFVPNKKASPQFARRK